MERKKTKPVNQRVKIYLLDRKEYSEGFYAVLCGEEVIRFEEDYFATKFDENLNCYVINSTYGRFRY